MKKQNSSNKVMIKYKEKKIFIMVIRRMLLGDGEGYGV